MNSVVVKLVAGLLAASLVAGAVSSAAEFGGQERAFFDRHCSDCHAATAKEGGLDLAALSQDLSNAETLRRWVRVYDRIAGGEMPPKGAPQPDTEAKNAVLASLGPTLASGDRAQREVVFRRLNRV